MTQSTISYGTVLRAKPHHPIHRRGGTGVAFVTDNGDGTDFFTFMWVGGDPATPGFSGDSGAIRHLDTWFDVVPDDQRNAHLPQGFVPPPDPRADPAAAFRAMFHATGEGR